MQRTQGTDDAGIEHVMTELDAALSPLRRSVRYASERGAAAVRYLEVTGGRWAGRALALDLPPIARERLEEVQAALNGFDALDADERDERVASLYASLSSLDHLLGLPLPVALAAASTSAAAPEITTSEPAPKRKRKRKSKERGSGKRGGRSGSTEDAAVGRGRRGQRRGRSKADASDSASARAPAQVRWADDRFGGAFINDLDASNQVVEQLATLGIDRVGALLMRRPIDVQVVQPVLGAGRLREPGLHAVGGRIRSRWSVAHPDGTHHTHAILQGAGPLHVRWSGGAPEWLVEHLAPGRRAVLVGRVELDESTGPILCDPELAFDDGRHAARLARYDLPPVSDEAIRSLIYQGLEAVDRLVDPLPSRLVARRGLSALGPALDEVHLRGDRNRKGQERLAYDEALLVHLALLWDRFQGARARGLSHTLLHRQASSVMERAGIELTDEQQLALEDVKRDLREPAPMRRVLTGEVGAGKGLVALLSVLIVSENKNQILVIAPDRATAEQRFAFTEPALLELGLITRLYVDPPSRSQRDAIRRGEVHVLYGTSDLLSQNLDFRRLGLVVAGERDTFGQIPPLVEALGAPQPDLLVITSTPVPAPVLLAAYPTFDFTVLRSYPGRPVPCSVVSAQERERAYNDAAQAVADGQQVMVVFPMIRGTDAIGASEAMSIVGTLQSRVFEGSTVRLFHGSMSRDERYRAWEAFRDRSVDVLLTTTHFEAGPAVQGASMVLVEQADRMSLSRLHRVRGHISVSVHAPRCILITGEDPDPEGIARVDRFAQSQHGFEVAVQELEQRGLASMVRAEPSPMPSFSFVDPLSDLDAFFQARADARDVLQADPGLRSEGCVELARYLRARWPDLLATPCPVQVSGGTGRRRRRRRRR